MCVTPNTINGVVCKVALQLAQLCSTEHNYTYIIVLQFDGHMYDDFNIVIFAPQCYSLQSYDMRNNLSKIGTTMTSILV